MRRPQNLEACKDWLLHHKDAQVRPGEYEADDLITMEAHDLDEIGVTPIICSIDKDLKQYPCLHYNFDKRTLEDVPKDTAIKNFYQQLLTGDNSDGITGIKGVGPKTAQKLLSPYTDPFDMYCCCLNEWIKRSPREEDEEEKDFLKRMLAQVRMNAQLLHLCRKEGDLWVAPIENT